MGAKGESEDSDYAENRHCPCDGCRLFERCKYYRIACEHWFVYSRERELGRAGRARIEALKDVQRIPLKKYYR